MAREMKNKRVPIPPIRYSDVDDLPVPEEDVATKIKSSDKYIYTFLVYVRCEQRSA